MKKLVMKLLVVYKKYISKGYNCRFYPNCSDYTYQAVDKYGVTKGLVLGLWRVLRCNPFNKGGVDLVK